MKESQEARDRRFNAIAAYYRERTGRTYDEHAQLRRAFVRLKADLADAHDDLDALATTDWPPGGDVVTQELTLREQLQLLDWRAARLFAHGYWAARILRSRVRALLGLTTTTAAFTAPPRTLVPPTAVALALARLRPLTPFGAALSTPQADDTPEVSRDRRLVQWFSSIVEG